MLSAIVAWVIFALKLTMSTLLFFLVCVMFYEAIVYKPKRRVYL